MTQNIDEDIDTEDNYDLDELQKHKDYKAFQRNMKNRLQKQWDALAISGIVFLVYSMLGHKMLSGISEGKHTKTDENKLLAYITGQTSKKIVNIGGQSFVGDMGKYLSKVWDKAVSSISDKIKELGGKQIQLTGLSEQVNIMLQKRIRTLAQGLDETTSKKFAYNIVRGLQKGLDQKQMTRSLMKLGKGISESRAELIAQTETNAALQYVRKEVAKYNGAMYKIWKTTDDEKTCSICRPLHGMRAKIDDSFENDLGLPPIHVRCRCWIDFEFSKDNSVLF